MKLSYKKIKNAYPRWDDGCITQDLADEGLLVLKIRKLRIRGSVQYVSESISLNREGKDVWKLCDGKNTTEEIISKLHKEYIVNKAVLAGDVIKMIENLLNKGYLTLERKKKSVRQRIGLEGYPHYKNNLTWKTLDENFVVMSMKNGAFFTFPKEMERLWNLCDGNNSMKHILVKAKKMNSLINGLKLARIKNIEEHILFILKLLEKLELIKISSSRFEKTSGF